MYRYQQPYYQHVYRQFGYQQPPQYYPYAMNQNHLPKSANPQAFGQNIGYSQMQSPYQAPLQHSAYPYPGAGFPFQKQKQPSQLMSAFMTPEGKFDFQKTFYTVDQIVKTASSIPPILKQFSAILPKR